MHIFDRLLRLVSQRYIKLWYRRGLHLRILYQCERLLFHLFDRICLGEWMQGNVSRWLLRQKRTGIRMQYWILLYRRGANTMPYRHVWRLNRNLCMHPMSHRHLRSRFWSHCMHLVSNLRVCGVLHGRMRSGVARLVPTMHRAGRWILLHVQWGAVQCVSVRRLPRRNVQCPIIRGQQCVVLAVPSRLIFVGRRRIGVHPVRCWIVFVCHWPTSPVYVLFIRNIFNPSRCQCMPGLYSKLQPRVLERMWWVHTRNMPMVCQRRPLAVLLRH